MKNKNWFLGLFFILTAVSVIAIQVGSFIEIGIWSLLLGALLVAFIISSIIRRNFFGVFLPLSFLYMIFWSPLGLTQIDNWIVLLVGVMLSIGFSILFHSNHKHEFEWYKKCEEISQSSEGSDDDNPYATVKFGSATKYLHSNCLKSGKFIAAFGELEVFFDQVQLSPDGAQVFVDCSFGSLKLNIPRGWKVNDRIHTTLGAVENKMRGPTADNDAPTLTLTGNVQFGAIEINYI